MYSSNLERVRQSHFGKSEPSPNVYGPVDEIAMEIADRLAGNFDPFKCAEAIQKIRSILINRLNEELKEIQSVIEERLERISTIETALKQL